MSTTVIHSIEHEIGLDGVLEIRIGDGDVRLRGVEGTMVRVVGDDHEDLDHLTIERGEGSLSIRSDGDDPDIAIEAPRGATLVVDSSSGGIFADAFTGEQRYRSAAGDMRLRDVTGQLAIEAVSGDVDATVTGSTGIAARTVSGDLAVRGGIIRTLRVATTSGDIRVAGQLAGPGPFTIESVSGDAQLALAGDLRIDLQTVAGDLRSDIPGRSESRPGKRTLTVGSGGPTVSVRTMSGDVRLVRPPKAIPPATAVLDDQPDAGEEARLSILRALERGEIDVTEAGRRLEALETPDPADATATDPTEATDA